MTGTLPRPHFALALVAGVLFVAGCGAESSKAITDGTIDTSVEVDEDAPVIDHVPIDSAQPILQDVDLRAIVTDELSAIDTVSVSYKRSDAAEWSSALLEDSGDEEGTWTGAIPGSDITGSNIFYFLTAIDTAGNTGFFPVDGEANPIRFRVNPDG